MAIIYGLRDPRGGGVRYVGKTVDPARRLRKHVENARKCDTYLYRWIRSLLSDGVRPEMVQFAAVPAEKAPAAEIEWIGRLRADGARLVNTADGGLGGRTLTDEARAARGERMRARWQDPEYRARMAGAHRGKTLPASARAKVGDASRQAWARDPERKTRHVASRLGKPGRVLTDDAKRRISASLTGKSWSPARRAAYERNRGSADV